MPSSNPVDGCQFFVTVASLSGGWNKDSLTLTYMLPTCDDTAKGLWWNVHSFSGICCDSFTFYFPSWLNLELLHFQTISWQFTHLSIHLFLLKLLEGSLCRRWRWYWESRRGTDGGAGCGAEAWRTPWWCAHRPEMDKKHTYKWTTQVGNWEELKRWAIRLALGMRKSRLPLTVGRRFTQPRAYISAHLCSICVTATSQSYGKESRGADDWDR